jgi:hypothetical protein
MGVACKPVLLYCIRLLALQPETHTPNVIGRVGTDKVGRLRNRRRGVQNRGTICQARSMLR